VRPPRLAARFRGGRWAFRPVGHSAGHGRD